MIRALLVCLALLASNWTATFAAGGNWVVLDLGPSRSESVCLEAAAQAFDDFGRIFGIESRAAGNWTVYGYGLEDRDTDGIVTCTFSTAYSSRATLILYGPDQIRASMTAARFEGYFAEHNRRLGEEWLQRALDRHDL